MHVALLIKTNFLFLLELYKTKFSLYFFIVCIDCKLNSKPKAYFHPLGRKKKVLPKKIKWEMNINIMSNSRSHDYYLFYINS